MEIRACPECGAPAEVEGHGVLTGSNGPVEHVRVWCVNRHWFLTARDLLPADEQATVTSRDCGR